MVALDNSALFGHGKLPRLKGLGLSLVSGIAIMAALLVGGAILARRFSENGFRLGSELGWRFTCVVFFAALAAGPLGRLMQRLIPATRGIDIAALSRQLLWGFCASYGVYLVSVFVPNSLSLSVGATMFVLVGAAVVLVTAASVAPMHLRPTGPGMFSERIRRTILGLAVIYFWACYTLMALSRIAGPHRPDSWYGISLTLMLLALALRISDRWIGRRATDGNSNATQAAAA